MRSPLLLLLVFTTSSNNVILLFRLLLNRSWLRSGFPPLQWKTPPSQLSTPDVFLGTSFVPLETVSGPYLGLIYIAEWCFVNIVVLRRDYRVLCYC